MKNYEILNTPLNLKNYILNKEDAYVIKVKCIGCTETKFFEYVMVHIKDNVLSISEHEFPLNLIESVTIKTNNKYFKQEITYKISNNYLISLLNEDAKKELEKYILKKE